jgi:hypothetical protein
MAELRLITPDTIAVISTYPLGWVVAVRVAT